MVGSIWFGPGTQFQGGIVATGGNSIDFLETKVENGEHIAYLPSCGVPFLAWRPKAGVIEILEVYYSISIKLSRKNGDGTNVSNLATVASPGHPVYPNMENVGYMGEVYDIRQVITGLPPFCFSCCHPVMLCNYGSYLLPLSAHA